MGIVGEEPETGFRVTLRRTALPRGAASASYDGEIAGPGGFRTGLCADVANDGTVSIHAMGAVSDEHQTRVKLLLRTIVKECAKDGRAQLPVKIVRWWGEK